MTEILGFTAVAPERFGHISVDRGWGTCVNVLRTRLQDFLPVGGLQYKYSGVWPCICSDTQGKRTHSDERIV